MPPSGNRPSRAPQDNVGSEPRARTGRALTLRALRRRLLGLLVPLGLVVAVLLGASVVGPAAPVRPLAAPLGPLTLGPAAGTLPLSVVATIGLPPSSGIAVGPPVVANGTGDVYVPDFATSTLEVLHGTSLVASVPVSGNPVSALYDPANGYIYVASTNTTSATVVAGTSVVGQVPVAGCASYAGQGAYDAGNGFVYLPNPCTGNVTVVNGTSVVATVPLVSATGSDTLIAATYDPGDGLVYVTYPVAGTVFVLNGTSSVGKVLLGGFPNPGTYDPANGLLYVTDSGTCNVSLVRNAALVANLTVGGSGCRDGFGGSATYDSANGFVYVSYEGGPSFHAYVAVLNGTTELAELDAGPHIAGSASYGAFGDGTGFVYQTTSESLNGGVGAGAVAAVGGTAIVGTLNLTSEPVGVVYEPSSGLVYLPTYTPGNLTTGLSTQAVVVVDCSACLDITFEVRGAAAGSSWNLTALNGTTQYAESAGSSSTSITLHLVDGTYRLLTSAPAGATVVLSAGNAVYDPARGIVRVGVVSPPPGPGFFSGTWLGVPTVGFFAGVVAALGCAGAGVGVRVSRRTVRREADELVARMREEIESGDPRVTSGG